MPTGLLIQCTVAFPVNDVITYLYYGAVFVASVVWLSLLGTTERACNGIAHKINKILHDKENTKDSSAI